MIINVLYLLLASSAVIAQNKEDSPSTLLAQKPGAPKVCLIEEEEKQEKQNIAESEETDNLQEKKVKEGYGS